jgi:hypothetical protein
MSQSAGSPAGSLSPLRPSCRLLKHSGTVAEDEFIRPQTKVNELYVHLEPSALGDEGLDCRALARRDDQLFRAPSHGPINALNPM